MSLRSDAQLCPSQGGLARQSIPLMGYATDLRRSVRFFWYRIDKGALVFAVLLAAIVLVVSAFSDDFSIAYIFHHSNRDLPAAYKFAVLWSGQEGSLLFWSLLLAGYGFVLRLRYKTDQRLFAYASVIIASVQVFFLLILNFAAPPFAVSL